MNSKQSQFENLQRWNEKLFNGSSKILSLKHQVIYNMLPGKSNNFHGDEMFKMFQESSGESLIYISKSPKIAMIMHSLVL